MTKTSSLSLLAVMLVAVAGISAPAYAEENGNPGFDEEGAISKLHYQGIEASDLQVWNGKVRATVKQADGTSTFQYFDVDTMKPIVATGNNARVLSELDVGQTVKVQPNLNSLTWEDPSSDN